jgi:hypothetical protein
VHHAVDIRVEPRAFNPHSGQRVTVDVFGTSELNLENIDLTTMEAGVTGHDAVPRTRPRFKDIDGDESPDLQVGFVAVDLGVTCDRPIVAFTAKTLTGETIAGSDTIDARNCRR